ncbi:unnamed protein product [Amoebophrya sp. A25]|nr:unnamed protein product [Amoebophrya sp. A25]|eukprot:GSA25T00002096001.1
MEKLMATPGKEDLFDPELAFYSDLVLEDFDGPDLMRHRYLEETVEKFKISYYQPLKYQIRSSSICGPH